MGSYRKINPDDLASSKEANDPSSPLSEKEAQPPSGKSKALLNIRRKSAEAKSLLSLRRKSVELSLNRSLDFQDKLLKSYTEAVSKCDDIEFTRNETTDQSSLKASVSIECLTKNSKTNKFENSLETNELRRSKSERRVSDTDNEPVRREPDKNYLCPPAEIESPRISPHPAFQRDFQSHSKDMDEKLEEAMEQWKEMQKSMKGETSLKPTDNTHWKMDPNNVLHKGGCHCGAVRFQVYAPSNPTVLDCNCSICVKKQNRHFIVPEANFKLLKGHDSLTTYTFNTHKAKHIFCSKCGVQSFYIPRANSNAYGITVHCLDEGTLKKEKIEKFDGKNLEENIKKKPHIQALTKAQ